MHWPIRRSAKLTAITGALTVLVVLGATQELAAQSGPSSESNNDVTFTRDVAPILQQNCQVCHQPGAIGPMSLMEYKDVRRYARRITRMV